MDSHKLLLSRRAFLLASLATTLAACGSSPGGSTTTATTPSTASAGAGGSTASSTTSSASSMPVSGAATPAASPAASPAATKASGPAKQTPVVIVQGADPPTLDPQFTETTILFNVEYQMFDNLLQFDRNMKLVPMAAESFQMMDDQVTWQFKIRKGIKFWNGEPLDAKAVKYTLDRMGDPALKQQGSKDPFYGRVGFDHADVVDDYTINIVLKKPTILMSLYVSFFPILASGYYSQHTSQQTAIAPMGSGPWIFKEWVKDDHLTMTANPDYWRGKPQIDTLIFKAVPDESTRVAMLQRNEADVISTISPDDFKTIQSVNDLRISKAPGGTRVGIALPTANPLFKDRRVRQAFNYAVDFDAINKSLLGGAASGRMVVPILGDWADPSLKPYPYDANKSKELLQAGGWDPNTQITINTPVGSYLKDKELAEAVAGMLQKVGVKAQVQALEYSVFVDKLYNNQLDQPFLIGAGSFFYGPDDCRALFTSTVKGITSWSQDSENGSAATKLYNQLTQTFDQQQQMDLVHQISKLYFEEAPWIFLWDQVALYGVNKRIDWEASGNSRINFWLPSEADVHFT